MLTNEKDLFIEDGAIGTFGCVRIGVRMISADPAYALIARSLLVPVPPRKCDHRARYLKYITLIIILSPSFSNVFSLYS